MTVSATLTGHAVGDADGAPACGLLHRPYPAMSRRRQSKEESSVRVPQRNMPTGEADMPIGEADMPIGEADMPIGEAAVYTCLHTRFRVAHR